MRERECVCREDQEWGVLEVSQWLRKRAYCSHDSSESSLQVGISPLLATAKCRWVHEIWGRGGSGQGYLLPVLALPVGCESNG